MASILLFPDLHATVHAVHLLRESKASKMCSSQYLLRPIARARSNDHRWHRHVPTNERNRT